MNETEKQIENTNESGAKYLKEIRGAVGDRIDVYSVIETFGVCCPARQHAIKKILCAGERGKASTLKDLTEAIDAIRRAIELHRDRSVDM